MTRNTDKTYDTCAGRAGRLSLTILGSTGSIGVNTLDVVAQHRDAYDIYALSAYDNVDVLAEQCLRFKPRYAAIVNEARQDELKQALRGQKTEVMVGAPALQTLAVDDNSGVVISGIVGIAGLIPLFGAVRAGKRVLFANKEPMVVAGSLIKRECGKSDATLVPLDSEHNAIMQCLAGMSRPVSLTLTASGGPFLNRPVDELAAITPAQACAHPNWEMGAKISVDSATMMNKGLEVIEAADLFDFDSGQIRVLIHPQSIVHGFVTYRDGSVIAQMAEPDMRIPIACALGWPQRISSGVKVLDLAAVGRLDFSEVNEVRFPCFALARQALCDGDEARVLLNAANEVAVAAFLSERLRFDRIASVVDAVLSGSITMKADSLEAVLAIDREGRRLAEESIKNLGV